MIIEGKTCLLVGHEKYLKKKDVRISGLTCEFGFEELALLSEDASERRVSEV